MNYRKIPMFFSYTQSYEHYQQISYENFSVFLRFCEHLFCAVMIIRQEIRLSKCS